MRYEAGKAYDAIQKLKDTIRHEAVTPELMGLVNAMQTAQTAIKDRWLVGSRSPMWGDAAEVIFPGRGMLGDAILPDITRHPNCRSILFHKEKTMTITAEAPKPKDRCLVIELAQDGGVIVSRLSDMMARGPGNVLLAATSIDEALKYIRGNMTAPKVKKPRPVKPRRKKRV